MQIPSNLSQFENNKSLLVSAGEFEAVFYEAKDGIIKKIDSFKMDPRGEIDQLQAYVSKPSGAEALGAASYKERYVENLKVKVSQEMSDFFDKILEGNGYKNILIFVPDYSEKSILSKIKKNHLDKIEKIFHGRYTKNSPLDLLDIIEKNRKENMKKKKVPASKEEEKILRRPETKPPKK